jgi:hypothetical protein
MAKEIRLMKFLLFFSLSHNTNSSSLSSCTIVTLAAENLTKGLMLRFHGISVSFHAQIEDPSTTNLIRRFSMLPFHAIYNIQNMRSRFIPVGIKSDHGNTCSKEPSHKASMIALTSTTLGSIELINSIVGNL